ncbi:MAG: lipid-A-disaccharide synthase, partial [Phycisphaerae bacterium]
FISAAEPSGDQHAAGLIQAIRELYPDATFFGIAGPKMQAVGCHAIEDWTSRSAMLAGAIRLVGRAFRLFSRVGKLLKSEPADLVILVDSPTLHLPMAKKAKAAGCQVLYYIAPQLWAWAPGRIRRVRRRVDRIACLLPFEEEYFSSRGVPARYVGHPLIEQLQAVKADPATVEAFRARGRPVVACLPGSRGHVIDEVLPGQIEVARAIAAQHPDVWFLFSAAGPSAQDRLKTALERETFRYSIEVARNAEVLSAADLALCASGTATLEVAYHRVPMVIMYNGSRWGYQLIARWLIRTPHLSLVNILAGRRIVPEFMPYYTSTAPIAAEALDLLANQPRREQMKADLSAIIASLGTGRAAQGAARIAAEMLTRKGFSARA